MQARQDVASFTYYLVDRNCALRQACGCQTIKFRAISNVHTGPSLLLLAPDNFSVVTTALAMLIKALGRILSLHAEEGCHTDWLRTNLRAQGIASVTTGKYGGKRRSLHDKPRSFECWRVEITL